MVLGSHLLCSFEGALGRLKTLSVRVFLLDVEGGLAVICVKS